MLYEADDDFKKVFKVRADFEVEMKRNDDAIRNYISFIKMICEEEKLKKFDKSAIAEIIEYGVRLSGRQNKLTTRFNIIADVIRETNYWATKDGNGFASAKHVQKAINERIERVKMIEEKIQEMIIDGTIFIDSKGEIVGQVNGLSVYDTGEYSFGKPSRITVNTAMGKAGIINIEREADLSGPSHNKGVLILSGYLRRLYAQNKPLVMSASIAFEQSYGGVDGDSASSTEIYAILSSLAEVPIRQDIAVTGSVNQKGEIQPIGGVNQKIEGFFDVCKARGLTGSQGVMIPLPNVPDLMLRHDVVEAVEGGKFHVYPIQAIDEGIEILTGVPAGRKLSGNKFPKGTIHFLVDNKLTEYAKRWKDIEACVES
jgi:lon-related putative ATP-dependent protease